MNRLVACLVSSIPFALALPANASVEEWSFFGDSAPVFIDARDLISWDAGQSIGVHGDVALGEIRLELRIARPGLPAYEPGTT